VIDIKAVQAPCRLDIDRVVSDFPDGRYSGQRQKKPKMVHKIRVCAGDRFARDQVLGL
jgi:hypothetical protein